MTDGECAKPGFFRCGQNIAICTNNIINCLIIDETCFNANQSRPFRCKAADDCVETIDDCCKGDGVRQGTKWCPSRNKCTSDVDSCCEQNSVNKPFACRSKNPESSLDNPSANEGDYYCVANQFECCGDLNYTTNSGEVKKMVKCKYEDKCVPEDTAEYCFQPLPVDICPKQVS